MIAQNDADKPIQFKDQQILDDLIVDGSACIGLDCVNGENFGFKTLRLKENNLRVHFEDTSSSASFPSSDWCIQINDSSNGGDEYYGIVDEDAGTIPFRIEEGAGNHALFVESGGNIGLNTNNPTVELHIVDGDTPTMRLEQNGSSGFTPQTWDVAGNETNFFIRDVTNGSRLPLKIRPSSPTGSIVTESSKVNINQDGANLDFQVEGDTEPNLIYVDASQDFIGIGTDAPTSVFEIAGTDNNSSIMAIGITGSTSNAGIRLKRGGGTQAGIFVNNDNDLLFAAGGSATVGSFEANGDFEVDGNVVASSDKRLKSNIVDYDKGLEAVMALNPIEYNYNGEGGISYRDRKIGLIAQELQKVAPEMVTNVEKETFDTEGNLKSSDTYLGIHENEIKYLLINAMKQQQELIEDQKQRLEILEQDNLELRESVETLQNMFEEISVDQATLSDQEGAFLKQNVPNPFNNTTQISYFVPEFSSSASLKVFGINGALIHDVDISQTGIGVINLKAENLTQGTYTYSLFVDGKIIDTQQMVLTE